MAAVVVVAVVSVAVMEAVVAEAVEGAADINRECRLVPAYALRIGVEWI
jgi:hypothetical protein